MSEGIRLDYTVHFAPGRSGERRLREGEKPVPPVAEGKVPRISRLMALAIRIDELVRAGEIEDFAAAAELGHVTRARMSQIVNLLNLAPTIQEALLELPLVAGDKAAITERELRSIASEPDWAKQLDMWGSEGTRVLGRQVNLGRASGSNS